MYRIKARFFLFVFAIYHQRSGDDDKLELKVKDPFTKVHRVTLARL